MLLRRRASLHLTPGEGGTGIRLEAETQTCLLHLQRSSEGHLGGCYGSTSSSVVDPERSSVYALWDKTATQHAVQQRL